MPEFRNVLEHRVARFAAVGLAAGATQLAMLNALIVVGMPRMGANGAAFFVAANLNFALSVVFTWADRSPRRGLAACWVAFFGAISGTALLNLGTFALAAPVMPHIEAAALGIAVAAAANYVLGDRAVFAAPSREGAHAIAVPISDAVHSETRRPQ